MVEEYKTLISTYKRMFSLVDVFHFNSHNTAEIYGKYLSLLDHQSVIPITHGGIKDYRQQKDYSGTLLRLGFIGSEAPFKGLPMLKEVLRELNNEGCLDKIQLNVYGGRIGIDSELKNMIYKGRFSPSNMDHVYNEMDLLVVPSICYETFGFTVLEALQYGVPSLVSNKVGSKDIVGEYAPQFVFSSKNELKQTLLRLTNSRYELVDANRNILGLDWKWSISRHANEIELLYY